MVFSTKSFLDTWGNWKTKHHYCSVPHRLHLILSCALQSNKQTQLGVMGINLGSRGRTQMQTEEAECDSSIIYCWSLRYIKIYRHVQVCRQIQGRADWPNASTDSRLQDTRYQRLDSRGWATLQIYITETSTNWQEMSGKVQSWGKAENRWENGRGRSHNYRAGGSGSMWEWERRKSQRASGGEVDNDNEQV